MLRPLNGQCIICLGLATKEDPDSTCTEAQANLIHFCPHVIKTSCMAQIERILIRDLSVSAIKYQGFNAHAHLPFSVCPKKHQYIMFTAAVIERISGLVPPMISETFHADNKPGPSL